MNRKCILNGMILDRLRKTQEYQAVMIDLAIEGAISVDAAERLLGYEIPASLHSPDGKSVADYKADAAKEEAPSRGKAKRSSE